MYISGSTTKFTLQYSYSHSATDGHLVKSRAVQNFILYNRLTGEAGTDSYEINLPNAGTSYVIGNLIQQGPQTGNSAILDYGSEGATNPGKDLYVINNTFVNDRGSGTFVSIAGGVTVPAVVKNNIFLGGGTLVSQSTAVLANNFSTGNPMLANRAGFDYHLVAGSPCINAGVDPGTSTGGFSLLPTAQYVHPLNHQPRAAVGTIDIGAYELGGSAGTSGTGGSAGTSGTGGSAGTSGTGGSAGSGTGGSAGTSGTGGSAGTSGSAGTGGTGGSAGTGGTGGSAGTTIGGAGGGADAGGGSGGSAAAGGASGRGGASGTRSVGGSSAATPAADDDGGCGCRMPTGSQSGALAWAIALLAAVASGRVRSSELFFERAANRPENLDPRVALVFGFDQGPGRSLGAGARQHVVRRAFVQVPLLAVAEVFLGDLVKLPRLLLAVLEAPELLLAADVQPELDEDRAVVGQLFLEIVDFLVGAHPFSLAREALDALDQDSAVPAAIVDREAPEPRQVTPEAPQVVMRAFLVVRCGNRDHAILTGVERLHDAADHAAFAGGVPPLEQQDRTPLLFGESAAQ